MVEGEMIPIPGEEPETASETETEEWLMGEPVDEEATENDGTEVNIEVEIMGDMVIED